MIGGDRSLDLIELLTQLGSSSFAGTSLDHHTVRSLVLQPTPRPVNHTVQRCQGALPKMMSGRSIIFLAVCS